MAFTDKTGASDAYYTYTKFKPYGAHKFIPCFDQPDLKAPVIFNIILPSDWIAVSN